MRRTPRLEISHEMNITNLLDTAFILIVMLMMVAPSIPHGLNIALPEVAGGNVETTSKTFTIRIEQQPVAGAEDRIMVDDRRVTLEELGRMVVEFKGKHEKADVVMEVDKSVPYDTFARALGVVKSAGVESIGLMTEPQKHSAAPVARSGTPPKPANPQQP